MATAQNYPHFPRDPWLRLALAACLLLVAFALTARAEVVAAPADFLEFVDWSQDTSELQELKAIRGWVMVAGIGSLLQFGAILWWVMAAKIRP